MGMTLLWSDLPHGTFSPNGSCLALNVTMFIIGNLHEVNFSNLTESCFVSKTVMKDLEPFLWKSAYEPN